jgi:hypothetical protein
MSKKTPEEIAKGIILSGLIQINGVNFDFLLHHNTQFSGGMTKQEREDIAHETRVLTNKLSQLITNIL